MKLDALLSRRLKNKEKSSKMATLAQNSSEGLMSGFTGIFGVSELSHEGKQDLRSILERYATATLDIEADHQSLCSITSEVRAISNQAALLHGERIKRAQKILKEYRDGAFTAWLISTYGNRQTPYNFLQYYDFFKSMPEPLHKQIELMPRQAIYALASREGTTSRKQEIVQDYSGQTKSQLLELIRETFPLPDKDSRRKTLGDSIFNSVKRLYTLVNKRHRRLSGTQKEQLRDWLDTIRELLE